MELSHFRASCFLASLAGLFFLFGLDINSLGIGLSNAIFNASLHSNLDIFIIAAVTLLVIIGKAADHIGYRRVFAWGCWLFSISALYQNFYQYPHGLFFLAHFLQCLGASAIFLTAYIMIFHNLPAIKRGKAIGLITSLFFAGETIASLISPWLVNHHANDLLYCANALVGFIALFYFYCFIPVKQKNHFPQLTFKIHYITTPVLVCALIFLISALSKAQALGFDSPVFVALFSSGMILLFIFIGLEKNSAKTSDDYQLIHNKKFISLVAIRTIGQYIFFTTILLVVDIFKNVETHSSLQNHLLLAVLATVALSAFFTGRLFSDFAPESIVLWSSCALTCALLILWLFTRHNNMNSLIFPALFLCSAAFGSLSSSTSFAVLKCVTPRQQGAALGLFFTLAFAGSIIGISLSILELLHNSANYLPILLANPGFNFNATEAALLQNLAAGYPSNMPLDQIFGQNTQLAQQIAEHIFLHGMQIIIVICLLLGLFAAILGAVHHKPVNAKIN